MDRAKRQLSITHVKNTDLKAFEASQLPLKRLKWSYFNQTLLKAHTALHQFEKLLNTIPKPKVILSSLSVIEALAALESQKIHLSIEEFFLLQSSLRKKKQLSAFHYQIALRKACRSIHTHPLNKSMLFEIHRWVKRGAPRHMEVGRYRTQQNWIGPEGCTKEEACFFPPSSKKITFYMQNLFHYAKSRERDPLVQTAIIIAQFLIIHPFRDGNGRISRILVPLLLYKKKILSYPLLFYSRYLKDYRDKYFRKLFDVTGRDRWEQWVLFFLKGIILQAQNERKKAKHISLLFLKLEKTLQQRYHRLSFLPFLFSHPVFSRDAFLKRYSEPLLKELKILKIIKPFKRDHFVFPALLRIIKKKPRKENSFRGNK